MVKIKMYNVEDGDFLLHFYSPTTPRKGEIIFVEYDEYLVKDLYYVVLKDNKDKEEFAHVEIEVKIVE